MKHYYENDFWLDFICFVPVCHIFANVHEEMKLFHFIKCIRLLKGIKIFNVPLMMEQIANYMVKVNKKKIQENPYYGEDNLLDLNHIELLVSLGISLKNLKLIINIFNISFFMGMFWLCYCRISMDMNRHFLDGLSDTAKNYYNTDYYLNQPIFQD